MLPAQQGKGLDLGRVGRQGRAGQHTQSVSVSPGARRRGRCHPPPPTCPWPPAPRVLPHCRPRSDSLDTSSGLSPRGPRGARPSGPSSSSATLCVFVRDTKGPGPGRLPLPPSCPSSTPPIRICHFIYLTYLFMERRLGEAGFELGLMDIQAGSGHRADHPRFAQLPALPALPGTGLATGTPPWHRAGHGDSTRTLLHPGTRGLGPSPGPLAEAEAALAPGAGFALLDPREFGDFCVDWDTVVAAFVSPPACSSTGGSRDTSPTVGMAVTPGAPAPSTGLAESPSHPKPRALSPVPCSGDTLQTALTPGSLPALTWLCWQQQEVKCPFSSPAKPGAALPVQLRAERGSFLQLQATETWDKEGTPRH